MLYIHQANCISPQETFAGTPDVKMGSPDAKTGMFSPTIGALRQPEDALLKAIEPSYAGIPAGILRRMSKSVKLGIGAAMPLLQGPVLPDGILMGTGNAGMEDSVLFLKQILDYDEGMLAPGNFVQSTPNSVAAQIGLLSRNKGYNITHVHRGLAFENALIDASMLVKEHPAGSYLVGGVDELSGYNYQIELADGWYKKEWVPGGNLYESDTPGSIAGEGAAMFLVNGSPAGAIARVKGIMTLHSSDEHTVMARLHRFLKRQLPDGGSPDLLLSGENGDRRTLKWYTSCEAMMDTATTLARFKHLCGEYATASAFALWLACQLEFRCVLIYNNHKFSQHSFMLIERFL
jgi:hypothetical protein